MECESESSDTTIESKRQKYVRHYDKEGFTMNVRGKLKIPVSVYNESVEHYKNFKGIDHYGLNKHERIVKFCYRQKRVNFDCQHARPFSAFYLITAAEMALNNRNYRTLYEIINKSLTLPFGYQFIWHQMKNYFLLAVMNDPMIQNKEEVLDDFMSRVLMLQTDRLKKKYLRDTFSLESNRQDDEEEEKLELEEDDDDMRNEEMKLFAEIKRERREKVL